MAGKVNLDELIHRLELDRRRCFVITGRPDEGKTRLAKQMTKRYQGQYLDLMTTFAENADLAAHIDTFTPRRCKDFLQPEARGELVLVDEFEFLWHRWNDSEKREFLNIIKVWSKPAFFCFFLPVDLIVDQFDMPDQDGRTRIFSLHDLQLSQESS